MPSRRSSPPPRSTPASPRAGVAKLATATTAPPSQSASARRSVPPSPVLGARSPPPTTTTRSGASTPTPRRGSASSILLPAGLAGLAITPLEGSDDDAPALRFAPEPVKLVSAQHPPARRVKTPIPPKLKQAKVTTASDKAKWEFHVVYRVGTVAWYSGRAWRVLLEHTSQDVSGGRGGSLADDTRSPRPKVPCGLEIRGDRRPAGPACDTVVGVGRPRQRRRCLHALLAALWTSER